VWQACGSGSDTVAKYIDQDGGTLDTPYGRMYDSTALDVFKLFADSPKFKITSDSILQLAGKTFTLIGDSAWGAGYIDFKSHLVFYFLDTTGTDSVFAYQLLDTMNGRLGNNWALTVDSSTGRFVFEEQVGGGGTVVAIYGTDVPDVTSGANDTVWIDTLDATGTGQTDTLSSGAPNGTSNFSTVRDSLGTRKETRQVEESHGITASYGGDTSVVLAVDTTITAFRKALPAALFDDSLAAQVDPHIGDYIDTTTVDTIQNAHKAVKSDTATTALFDANGAAITAQYLAKSDVNDSVAPWSYWNAGVWRFDATDGDADPGDIEFRTGDGGAGNNPYTADTLYIDSLDIFGKRIDTLIAAMDKGWFLRAKEYKTRTKRVLYRVEAKSVDASGYWKVLVHALDTGTVAFSANDTVTFELVPDPRFLIQDSLAEYALTTALSSYLPLAGGTMTASSSDILGIERVAAETCVVSTQGLYIGDQAVPDSQASTKYYVRRKADTLMFTLAVNNPSLLAASDTIPIRHLDTLMFPEGATIIKTGWVSMGTPADTVIISYSTSSALSSGSVVDSLFLTSAAGEDAGPVNSAPTPEDYIFCHWVGSPGFTGTISIYVVYSRRSKA